MEPVTLILDTTSRLFLKWVAKYAWAWHGLSWPVGDGTLSLSPPRYDALAENAAAEWFVPGIMQYPDPDNPNLTHGDMTVHYPFHVVQFTVTPLTDKSIEVVAECIPDPRAEGLLHEILAEIAQRWPDARAQSVPIDEVATGNDDPAVPTRETVRRAELFRRIKDAHPEYSYQRVANEATRQDKVRATSSEAAPKYESWNIRDAYRAMGWTWERADSVR